MFNKLVAVTLVCALFAFVQCAPQFDQEYHHQPEQKSRYQTAEGSYHQDPNLEYNFQ